MRSHTTSVFRNTEHVYPTEARMTIPMTPRVDTDIYRGARGFPTTRRHFNEKYYEVLLL